MLTLSKIRTVLTVTNQRSCWQTYKKKSSFILLGRRGNNTNTCNNTPIRIIKRYDHDNSDEVFNAKEAAKMKGQSTIFDKIIDKTIPADIIHEDDKCLAFHDVNPQAPVHMLVIPKFRITMLSESTSEHTQLLGHLLNVAREVADNAELSDGYRIVINNGVHGSQSIYHLHIHVMGGRQMQWPPG